MAVVTGRPPVAEKLLAQQLLGQEGTGWLLSAQQRLARQQEQRRRAAELLPAQALGSGQLS